jgi:hypothetical protein
LKLKLCSQKINMKIKIKIMVDIIKEKSSLRIFNLFEKKNLEKKKKIILIQ